MNVVACGAERSGKTGFLSNLEHQFKSITTEKNREFKFHELSCDDTEAEALIRQLNESYTTHTATLLFFLVKLSSIDEILKIVKIADHVARSLTDATVLRSYLVLNRSPSDAGQVPASSIADYVMESALLRHATLIPLQASDPLHSGFSRLKSLIDQVLGPTKLELDAQRRRRDDEDFASLMEQTSELKFYSAQVK